jgi:transcriptional regulator with XRE-family HTH domain
VTPPTFDGPRFARWLRRWKEAESLEWGQIAERSGLNASTVLNLANGAPQAGARRRGQTVIDPRVSTLARLAQGLGLELAYVLERAGLDPEHGGRWSNFTAEERFALARAIGKSEEHSPAMRRLARELSASLNTTSEDTKEHQTHA